MACCVSLVVKSVVGALIVANKSGVCVASVLCGVWWCVVVSVAGCVVLLHACCCMSVVACPLLSTPNSDM